MRLKEHESAPGFAIDDIHGDRFDLASPRDRPLMLCFFRYASCPLCNLRVHRLIQEYDNLKEKLDIVMVFQSPAAKIKQYVGQQEIPYILVPDPDRNLYRLYRVESSWIGFMRAWTFKIKNVFAALFTYRYLPGSVEGEIHRVPADFIIGIDGKILRAFYGKEIGDHLPLHEIKRIVNSDETG